MSFNWKERKKLSFYDFPSFPLDSFVRHSNTHLGFHLYFIFLFLDVTFFMIVICFDKCEPSGLRHFGGGVAVPVATFPVRVVLDGLVSSIHISVEVDEASW